MNSLAAGVAATALAAHGAALLALVRAVAIGADLIPTALTSLVTAFGLRHFDLLSPWNLHISGRLERIVR
jgi:hypothetical protein